MSGLTSARLLPADGVLPSRTYGSTTSGALETGTTAPCESFVGPPLLRDPGNELAVADHPAPDGQLAAGSSWADSEVDVIVEQLAPIRSEASLLSSYAREADPSDERVRSAYARAWTGLVMGGARSSTRRARIQATIVRPRLRGRHTPQ